MAASENALGNARRRRGLSRAEVARIMGVSDSRVGGIEHTVLMRLSTRVLALYANALGAQVHIAHGEVYLVFPAALGGEVIPLDTTHSVRRRFRTAS